MGFKEYEERNLFEMANVDTVDSGLPFSVWIDHNGVDRRVKHNSPRIKIEIDHKLLPYLIDDSEPKFLTNTSHVKKIKSRDIDELNRWVIENYQVLMDHWNGLISDKEALNKLTHI